MQDTSSLISIIIPIYCAQQYLSTCVDSVLRQTYTNIEVILVDDGSPDACPALCDQYAKTDHRITVIHKKNGGVSSARNCGIWQARGEWISFVDADDWVAPDMYERLYRGIQTSHAEIAICSYYFVMDKGKIISNQIENGVINKEKFAGNFWRYNTCIYCNSPFNKLYKKSVLKNAFLQFDESVKIGEDLIFNLAYLEQIHSICMINECLYYYNMGITNSAMHSFNKDYYLYICKIIRAKQEFLTNNDANTEKNRISLQKNNVSYFIALLSNYVFSDLSEAEKQRYYAVLYPACIDEDSMNYMFQHYPYLRRLTRCFQRQKLEKVTSLYRKSHKKIMFMANAKSRIRQALSALCKVAT